MNKRLFFGGGGHNSTTTVVIAYKRTLHFLKCILGAQARFKVVIKSYCLHKLLHALLLNRQKAILNFG